MSLGVKEVGIVLQPKLQENSTEVKILTGFPVRVCRYRNHPSEV